MATLNYKKDYVQVNRYSRPGIRLHNLVAIVVHYTANPKATAQNHQDYFDGSDGGGSRYAGAHIFVDKKEAIEIVPLNEVAYHANEKASRLSMLGNNANFTTVGIEMCVEADGSFHPDTVERTILVIKKLMAEHPSIKHVVRHYDVTGKICPKPFVNNPVAWTLFLNRVAEKRVNSNEETKSEVVVNPSKPKDYVSIVAYLNDRKMDSSFAAREKLAKQYGISGYRGTAEQNTKLLDLLQKPKPAPKPVSKPSSSLPNTIYRATRPYPSGTGVRAVQQALASVYFYPNKGAKNNGVDGVYGPNTADAVRRFQLTHGLKADGVYGPNTKQALEKAKR